MINEGISIVGLSQVNNKWSRIPIKENIYNMTDDWFIRRSISAGYNQVTTSERTFQSVGISIMDVDEVSCIAIAIGQ